MGDAFNFDGLDQGAITQRDTPGAGVKLSSLSVFVDGAKIALPAALADGNSADMPAADGSNPRIDLLLSDGTWQSGTAAASPAFPTPTSGKTWLVAVWRRANNNVVHDYDDGTNSFIYGYNLLTRSKYSRTYGSSIGSIGTSYISVTNMRIPVWAKNANMMDVRSKAAGKPTDALLLGFDIDGTDYDITNGACVAGDGGSSSDSGEPADGAAAIFRPVAAGAHYIQLRAKARSGTLTGEAWHMEVEIGK